MNWNDIDIDAVLDIALEAGKAILHVYEDFEIEVQEKADHSPLTEADLASHRAIVAGLEQLTPDVPIISEEGGIADAETRGTWSMMWIVDPLDGTKEFIKRNGEFTVNIALVLDGEPVLGVVHAPVLGDSWMGQRGKGAWYVDHRESGPDRVPMKMTAHSGKKARLVTSRSHAGPETEALVEQLASKGLQIDRVSFGSSLKLCMVAAGHADLYPRLGPTMEWDTAAAHAVVGAAGGHVVDFLNRPLTYNKADQHNPHFAVCGPEGLEYWILAADTTP